MAPKSDVNSAGHETSEFPILCETCLGPNPYVRMTRQPIGSECKVCTRPFTVFRWQPGSGSRMKSTMICAGCAKSKNCCQTCILDLQFGLPTQVRDQALRLAGKQAPTSAINREYFAQNQEAAQADGSGAASGAINYGKADSAGKELLKKLARSDPLYKRNRPKLCSFFAKGECNRGDACPYRHELPVENELAHQNIQDRYHGRNDPVANKILAKNAVDVGLAPPADLSITSLFLSALAPTVTEDDIRHFYTSLSGLPPSSLKSVVLVPTSKVAFVNFSDRDQAELAAAKSSARVVLAGKEVKVQWGRSRPKKAPAPAPVA